MSIPHSHKVHEARVDESIVEFPTGHPTGAQILQSVGKRPCSHFVVQIIKGADDEVIHPDQKVDLEQPGLERFAIVAREQVEIHIDSRAFEVKPGEYAVATLKRLGGVPEENKLSLDVDGYLKDLPDNSTIKIQGCEVFESRKPAGGSS